MENFWNQLRQQGQNLYESWPSQEIRDFAQKQSASHLASEAHEKNVYTFDRFLQTYNNPRSDLLKLNLEAQQVTQRFGKSHPLSQLSQILMAQKNIDLALANKNAEVVGTELYRAQNIFSSFAETPLAQNTQLAITSTFARLKSKHQDQAEQYQNLTQSLEQERHQWKHQVLKTSLQAGAGIGVIAGAISSFPVAATLGLGWIAYSATGNLYDSAQSVGDNINRIYENPTLTVRQKIAEVAFDSTWLMLEGILIYATKGFYQNAWASWVQRGFSREAVKTTLISLFGAAGTTTAIKVGHEKVEEISDGFIHQGLAYFYNSSDESMMQTMKSSVVEMAYQFPSSLKIAFLTLFTWSQIKNLLQANSIRVPDGAGSKPGQGLVPHQSQLPAIQSSSKPPSDRRGMLFIVSEAAHDPFNEKPVNDLNPQQQLETLIENHLEKTLGSLNLPPESYSNFKTEIRQHADQWVLGKLLQNHQNHALIIDDFKIYSKKIQLAFNEIVPLFGKNSIRNSKQIRWLCNLAVDNSFEPQELEQSLAELRENFHGFYELELQLTQMSWAEVDLERLKDVISDKFWEYLFDFKKIEDLITQSSHLTLSLKATFQILEDLPTFDEDNIAEDDLGIYNEEKEAQALVHLARESLNGFFEGFSEEELKAFPKTWPLLSRQMLRLAKQLAAYHRLTLQSAYGDLLKYLSSSQLNMSKRGEPLTSVFQMRTLLNEYEAQHLTYNPLAISEDFLKEYDINPNSALYDKLLELLRKSSTEPVRSKFEHLKSEIDRYLKRQSRYKEHESMKAVDIFAYILSQPSRPYDYDKLCKHIALLAVEPKSYFKRNFARDFMKFNFPNNMSFYHLQDPELHLLLKSKDPFLNLQDYHDQLKHLGDLFKTIAMNKTLTQSKNPREFSNQVFQLELMRAFRSYVFDRHNPYQNLDELIEQLEEDVSNLPIPIER